MVERERQLGNLAQSQLPLVCPRAVDDPADPQHGGLGVVDDRRRTIDSEHPVVVQGERPSGHLRGAEGAVAGQGGQLAQGSRQLGRSHLARAMDDGHHEPARRLCCEAQVDSPQLHQLLGLEVDTCVELGELLESRHADPRQQGKEADTSFGVGGSDLVSRRHQSGRVDVDPGGDVGDLATTCGHLVGDHLAYTTQRDPYVVSPVRANGTVGWGQAAGPERGLYIGPADHSAGPGGSQAGQVNSPVLGQFSHYGRDDLGRQSR